MSRPVWDRPESKAIMEQPTVVVLTVGQLCATAGALAEAEVAWADSRGEFPYTEICGALARVMAVVEGAME